MKFIFGLATIAYLGVWLWFVIQVVSRGTSWMGVLLIGGGMGYVVYRFWCRTVYDIFGKQKRH